MSKADHVYARKVLPELTKEFERAKTATYLFLPMIIGSIVLSVYTRSLAVAVVLMVIILGLYFFIFRKLGTEYAKHLSRENAVATVGALLKTDRFYTKGGAGLTEQDVREAELIKTDAGNRKISFFDAMAGKCGRLPSVITQDVAIAQNVGTGKRQGPAYVNCGNWIHAVLPKDTGLDLRVLQDTVMPDGDRELYFGARQDHLTERDPAEAGLSSEGWHLYLGKGTEPEQIPERFVKGLQSLREYTTGDLAVSVRGASADLYIRDRFLTLNYQSTTKPTEEVLTFDPFPELTRVADLFETLLLEEERGAGRKRARMITVAEEQDRDGTGAEPAKAEPAPKEKDETGTEIMRAEPAPKEKDGTDAG